LDTSADNNTEPDTFLRPVQLQLVIPSDAVVKETRLATTLHTQIIQCTVQNEDPNQLTFRWTTPMGKLRGDNMAVGKAAQVAWDAPGTPGQYTISVEVTNSVGQKTRGQVVFDVQAGS
jgi:hypothetical protein